jgi:outer membrane protein insertion porin family
MRGKVCLTLVLLILPLFALSAQQQQQPRYSVIAGISVEGLRRPEEATTVIAYSGLRVGSEARPDDLVMAVRNLWQRKQFADVRIEKDRETSLGAFLTIRVTEFPRLQQISIEGNDELSTDEIMKAIGKVNDDIMSPYDEYLARLAVKKKYAEEDLAFAKVTSELIQLDSAGQVMLKIMINEGVEYHVGSIVIEGNESFADEEVIDALEETNMKSWYEFWASSEFKEKEYKEDLAKIKAFYAKNGFIDADVVRDTVVFNEQDETVAITIWVEEGKQVHVRNITFTGNTVYESDMLVRRLGFSRGEVFDAARFDRNLNVNEEQSDVTSLYADNGYLQASLQPEFQRVSDDTIDVVVKVYERDRFTIRRVDIKGNTKTRDRVIRRELFIRPGDYFNRSAIIRTLRGLGVLNYFNPESFKPEILPVDNTKVDIVLGVEERSTDTFNASIGFAGAFGLTGAIGVTLNNFDITQPLRGGGGQVLSFQWEFGQASRLQTFQLSFTEPWLMGEPTSIGFNVYDTRQNFNISVRRTGGQVNVGRRLRWPDDFFRMDWSVAYERIESNTASIFSRAGTNTALTLGQIISRTSYDNIMFPTSGSRLVLNTRITAGSFGIGTTDYGKIQLNLDMANPLLYIGGNPRVVMFMGMELGMVDGIQVDTTIPPTELYYMGGNGLGGFSITPLRGYPDNSIGPIGPLGQNLGGRFVTRLLAEVRFALSLNPFPIYLLTFAEAGNVWATMRNADPFGLKRAAGFGVRLMLQPIGLIGFDLGYGFDPVGATGPANGWQFHFQFGR